MIKSNFIKADVNKNQLQKDERIDINPSYQEPTEDITQIALADEENPLEKENIEFY
jgi:hypothetical protein